VRLAGARRAVRDACRRHAGGKGTAVMAGGRVREGASFGV
jgi:hypothetical protein